MELFQKTLTVEPKRRGFHLITDEIESKIGNIGGIKTGIAHLIIQHTSASLSLNENADPDVRRDMETIFNTMVPENNPDYIHTFEGSDDMPAHAKSSILGASVTIPITNGRFNLGTWQGIYICEHRNHASSRRLVLTVMGNK